MGLTLEHDETVHRYRLLRDGDLLSYADYRPSADGSTLVFHHTLTKPEHRDQGYAAELVGRALDDVRTSGRSVVATCWYVADFIDTHPEYQDLLAPEPDRF
jgi:predicted GNAT family acetyltransferase